MNFYIGLIDGYDGLFGNKVVVDIVVGKVDYVWWVIFQCVDLCFQGVDKVWIIDMWFQGIGIEVVGWIVRMFGVSCCLSKELKY